MSFDYTQGDPALVLTENGSDIEFKGGQPVMDQGLQNAAFISLFTTSGWWGNDLTEDANKQIGSDFEEVARQAITVTAIRKIQAAAERALKWMVDSGLALATAARATNPRTGQLDVGVGIQSPSRDVSILAATRHGANWIAQRDYPAHRRLTDYGD